MGLATCKTCGGQVADTASKCPHCGAVRTKSTTKFLAVFIVVGVGLFIYNLVIFPPRNMGTEPAPAPAAIKTPAELARDRHLTVGAMVLSVWRKNLNDPSSAQLSQALLMDDGSLCMTVRARNGFNALMPASLVIGPDGRANISEQTDHAAFRRAWNTHCGNKTGSDETELLKIMAKF